MRHPHILKPDFTTLLIIDIQEKLISSIFNREEVIHNAVKLIKVANRLEIPVILTEQYPQGLGPTIPEITEELVSYDPIDKLTFSCCGVDEFFQRLESKSAEYIIMAGVETHVCVAQTALDLTENGYHVHLVADATGSRNERDFFYGLQRLSGEKVTVTTCEAAIFELLVRSGTPEFKDILKIIK